MEKPATPELDKLLAVKDKSQVIGDFLNHLQEGEVYLCQLEDDDDGSPHFVEIEKTLEQVLAMYFGIDLDRCEEERVQLLEWVRASQEE